MKYLGIEKKIIGFNVTMNESELMNIINSRSGLGNIELGHLFTERVLLDEQRHHVATWQELHDEIEISRVLERVVHLDDPLVIGLGQNIAFGANVRHLLFKQHVLLAQDLHRVDVTRILLLHQSYFAESSFTDHFQRREVVVRQFQAL